MEKLAKLEPFISHTVWGGSKLAKIKSLDASEPIGETWEVSTHKMGPSKIDDKNLNQFFELSYLVKFIDTNDHLSIQVHPDDDYAREHESSKGKTECWLILEAASKSGIYLGLKPGVTKKEFKTALSNNLKINELLNFIEVKPGDFFYIPAGTIHAIGSGVTLCEVQQNSGVTYRVWDWNRMGLDGKPRELHIDKALDVINFKEDFTKSVLSKNKQNLFDTAGIIDLVKHNDFKAQLLTFKDRKNLQISLKEKDSIVVLDGQLSKDINLSKMRSAIALEAGVYDLEISDKTTFLIISEM